MAHLFLSYAREDRECAELLARALAGRGWSVWWDRQIQVGESFSAVIEKELDQARCVIVLWSRHAIASEWVQNEAAEAARRKVLVPVRIEDVRPPLEFRRLQTADLFDWKKGFDSPDFDSCLASIERLVRKTAAGSTPLPVEAEQPPAPPPLPPRPRGRPTDYWISQDAQEFRAPDLATVRRWIEEGRVRADSYVHDPTQQRWVLAYELAGLPVVNPVVAQPPEERPRRKSNFLRPLIAIGVGVVVLVIFLVSMSSIVGRSSSPENTFVDTTAFDTAVREAQKQLGTESEPDPKMQAVPTSISVSIENRCTAPIAVAVCYLSPKGGWISHGWINVAPQETQPKVVEAVGPMIYFYAVSAQLNWHGEENAPTTRFAPIHMTDPFDVPADEFKGGIGFTSVPFLGVTMDVNDPSHTQTFTCNP